MEDVRELLKILKYENHVICVFKSKHNQWRNQKQKKMKKNCQIFKISLNQFKTNAHAKVMIK